MEDSLAYASQDRRRSSSKKRRQRKTVLFTIENFARFHLQFWLFLNFDALVSLRRSCNCTWAQHAFVMWQGEKFEPAVQHVASIAPALLPQILAIQERLKEVESHTEVLTLVALLLELVGKRTPEVVLSIANMWHQVHNLQFLLHTLHLCNSFVEIIISRWSLNVRSRWRPYEGDACCWQSFSSNGIMRFVILLSVHVCTGLCEDLSTCVNYASEYWTQFLGTGKYL